MHIQQAVFSLYLFFFFLFSSQKTKMHSKVCCLPSSMFHPSPVIAPNLFTLRHHQLSSRFRLISCFHSFLSTHPLVTIFSLPPGDLLKMCQITWLPFLKFLCILCCSQSTRHAISQAIKNLAHVSPPARLTPVPRLNAPVSALAVLALSCTRCIRLILQAVGPLCLKSPRPLASPSRRLPLVS